MSLYTRRHYVQFARSIAERRAHSGTDLFASAELDAEVARLVETFKRDNSNFNPERFITACRPVVKTTRKR